MVTTTYEEEELFGGRASPSLMSLCWKGYALGKEAIQGRLLDLSLPLSKHMFTDKTCGKILFVVVLNSLFGSLFDRV